VALLLGVAAVAVAVWAPMSPSSKAPGAMAPGDAKIRVCTAFDTVSKAVPLQTHLDLGPDPVAQVAVAANARLSLIGGGQYLLNSLDSATPPQLADAVRSFASYLQDIGMYRLAGVTDDDPDEANRLTQGDVARKRVADLCR
jgi:hypothetical protein